LNDFQNYTLARRLQYPFETGYLPTSDTTKSHGDLREEFEEEDDEQDEKEEVVEYL
jgi:hypothetical protein